MSTGETGGAAFPVLPPCCVDGAMASGYPYPEAGMTLRDYFAGQSLVVLGPYAFSGGCLSGSWLATEAYRLADAMLAARGAKDVA